ncbi:hypothetical protein C8Q76DRAFT_796898 [Earliella scabrosa]|nr:hypothetical protein C8Q76DRAFT_796898 [Earliella scabrosa]
MPEIQVAVARPVVHITKVSSSIATAPTGKEDEEKTKVKPVKAENGSHGWVRKTDMYQIAKNKRRSSVSRLPLTHDIAVAAIFAAQVTPNEKEVKGRVSRQRVIGLHDCAAGCSDGLRTEVVSEVLDGWQIGKMDGKRGLFPTTYIEVLNTFSSLPQKPPTVGAGHQAIRPETLHTLHA